MFRLSSGGYDGGGVWFMGKWMIDTHLSNPVPRRLSCIALHITLPLTLHSFEGGGSGLVSACGTVLWMTFFFFFFLQAENAHYHVKLFTSTQTPL